MKPLEVNLHLALEQIARVKEELWEVQLQEFPDSVPVSVKDMIAYLYEARNPYIKSELERWDMCMAPCFSKVEDAKFARREFMFSLQEKHRADIGRQVAMAQVQDPCGIFYVCGRREDGSYRYLGFRFGFEGSDYRSGFPEIEGGYRVSNDA
jgi:hypothetical protein